MKEDLYTLERIGGLVCDANDSDVDDPFPGPDIRVFDFSYGLELMAKSILNSKYSRIIYNPEFGFPDIRPECPCDCRPKR